MEKQRFVYAIYILAAPEAVFRGLVDNKSTEQYWGHWNVSDWMLGSPWKHQRCDEAHTVDIAGTVLESAPPRRLVVSWAFPADAANEAKVSRVAFDLDQPTAGVTCLTVTHDGLEPRSDMLKGITEGWPAVLSGLKTLLETGKPLPQWW